MYRGIKLSCIAVLFTMGACGTSPDPNYYTLEAVPGIVTNSEITGIVKIVQPELPEFLDRPDFVSQHDRYEVNVNETANWAEPLASLFERILADDMQQRLPHANVQTDADDKPTLTPYYIIETKLQQFNPIGQGQIVLSGDLMLTDLNKSRQVRHVSIRLNVNGSDKPFAVAAALSVLIGKYADQIAAELLSTQRL